MKHTIMVKSKIGQVMSASALTLSILSLTACGKTAFTVVPGTEKLTSPGTYTIPPKVDIVLFQSTKGRMFEAWNQMSGQLPQFLATLDKQNWDYHFTVLPLSRATQMQTATASQYDGNYGSNWKAPYPGAPQFTLGTITANYFEFPSNFSGFLDPSYFNTLERGKEAGFDGMTNNLKNSFGNSNFIRPDALLLPVIVSLADDTSDVNMINVDGKGWVPANDGSSTSSFNSYLTGFKTAHPNAQFQAIVAASASSNCLGSIASAGSRYMKLAGSTGGKSFDICSMGISQILPTFASGLQAQKQNFRQKYIFIAQDANPASIVVTVTKADGSQVQIPQDKNNGWTYVGYVQNVAAIDSPAPMNYSTGYAIQLNGSAELSGNDTPSVSYTPAGAQDSVSK
jgi:hypothetical protein